jgi:hypothetical protein
LIRLIILEVSLSTLINGDFDVVGIEIISRNCGGGGEGHAQLTLRVTQAFRESRSSSKMSVSPQSVTAKLPFCHFHFTLTSPFAEWTFYRSGTNSSALLLTFC